MRLWRSNTDEAFDQPDDDFVHNNKNTSKPRIVGGTAITSSTSSASRTNATVLTSHGMVNETHHSWNVAFRTMCWSRQTLVATPQQVLEHLEQQSNSENTTATTKKASSLELPKQNTVVVFTSEGVIPAIVKKYRQREEEIVQAAAAAATSHHNKSSWSHRTWQIAKITAHWLQTVISVTDEEADDESWNEQNDDHTSEQDVGWQQPLVNIELAAQCCLDLVEHAATAGAGKVFLRHGESQHSIMTWIRSLPTRMLVSRLPEDQINLLITALIEMNHAAIVDDVLVLCVQDHDRDTQIALFRLTVAIETTEASLERWSTQRDAALARAVECKKQNRISGARLELKRKALYEWHLDQTHCILLNLEQTRHAVETAQSQAQLIQVLETTAETWKLVQRQETGERLTVEQIDDLALDLAEELEHLDDVHDKLQQLGAPSSFSESELLQDFENLSIIEHGTVPHKEQSPSDEVDTTPDPSSVKEEAQHFTAKWHEIKHNKDTFCPNAPKK